MSTLYPFCSFKSTVSAKKEPSGIKFTNSHIVCAVWHSRIMQFCKFLRNYFGGFCRVKSENDDSMKKIVKFNDDILKNIYKKY